MAQKGVDTEALTCTICSELLKEPVTIPCGHSFCSCCVQSHWDLEESQSEYSCPDCRESFSPRPVPVKSLMLSGLVQQMKETGQTAPPVIECLAGPGDVPCDVCNGRKLKAVQSCLQCLVSYCEHHIQPHRDVAVLQRHQLVAPFDKLQEYLCSEHNEVKKMFCRSDQQFLCLVCCMDQHKGHDTVSSSAERVQRQTELVDRKQQLLKTINDSETCLKRLQEEAQAISRSAQDAVQRSGNSFTQMILLLEQRCSEVEQQIRDQEKSELRQIHDLQDQVLKDIAQMKMTLFDIDTLFDSPDLNHFLQLYYNLPSHGQTTAVSTVPSEELSYFDSVITAVSTLKDKLQLSLTQSKAKVSTALTEVHSLLSSRQGFLKYACDITLDPNTAHRSLCLSDGNRRVTKKKKKDHNYPDHPDRFTGCYTQVLNREALRGRCYWEVEWTGSQTICLALVYRDIDKSSVWFGDDDQCWALQRHSNSYSYKFNKVSSQVPQPPSSRLGVFLDHSAGSLSFYSVEDQTLGLILRVQAIFTQPLHVGVMTRGHEDTVYFPQIKQH